MSTSEWDKMVFEDDIEFKKAIIPNDAASQGYSTPLMIRVSAAAQTTASESHDVTMPFKCRLVDAVVHCTGDPEAGETVVIGNASGAWATLDLSGGAANAVFRPLTTDETYQDITANTAVSIDTTDASFDGAEIYITLIKIA